MFLALICGLSGWAYAVFQMVMNSRDEHMVREHYDQALTFERARVQELITQVQVNAQGMPHYPTLGPLPQEPVTTRILTDETGLIEVEVPLNEDDFAEFDTSYSYSGTD